MNEKIEKEQILQWNTEGLLAEVVGFETDEVALSANGSSVGTFRGRQYLDFTSGIAVHAVGHGHSEVVTAIQRQAARVQHTSDVLRHAPQLELAHWIRGLLSSRVNDDSWAFQFMNSGSESVDAAAKLALKATGRPRFISFKGGFHGRTLFATALSCSNTAHRQAYEPLLSKLSESILHASPARWESLPGHGTSDPNDLEALIHRYGDEVAAVFFEPQQGEGGYFPMAPEVAKRMREVTEKRGILLIADEIQSGFGRTGRWFGFEHLSIVPDIVVFGKAVGGGLPLAGLTASKSLLARWSVGEHGTTFGGNPIACAAGLAALQQIEKDGLVERAALLGEEIKAQLCQLVGQFGVSDVRGNGLMIGIEIRGNDGKPDYARVDAIKRACRDRGLLILSCGARIGVAQADNSTIRLLPPLNIPADALEQGLTILTEAIRSCPILAPQHVLTPGRAVA